MESETDTNQTCIRADVDEEKIHSLQKDVRDNEHLESVATVAKSAGSDTRMRILYLLWKGGELCVCDLADILQLSQPAISQQLGKLRGSGLVDSRREAQTLYHRISTNHPFARMLVDLFEEQRSENNSPRFERKESAA